MGAKIPANLLWNAQLERVDHALGPAMSIGKVRHTFNLKNGHLLQIATDRLSIFDFVLNAEVPKKGEVLTAMTVFWLTGPLHEIANHLVAYGPDIDKYLPAELQGDLDLQRRAVVIKRLYPIEYECIVRGYLTGTGLKDYHESGIVGGHRLPEGLHDGSCLPEPIFTPSTKAEEGHDKNVAAAEVEAKYGSWPEAIALQTYTLGGYYCQKFGFIVADTKFELGLDDKKRWYLIDEVLTPDSSRFWSMAEYDEAITQGRAPSGWDKQPAREWGKQVETPFGVTGINNLSPSNPEHVAWIADSLVIPPEIIEATSQRYQRVLKCMLDAK